MIESLEHPLGCSVVISVMHKSPGLNQQSALSNYPRMLDRMGRHDYRTTSLFSQFPADMAH